MPRQPAIAWSVVLGVWIGAPQGLLAQETESAAPAPEVPSPTPAREAPPSTPADPGSTVDPAYDEDPDFDEAAAPAAPGRFPMVYSQRPLVLTRGKLRLDAAPTSFSIDNSGQVGGAPGRGLSIGRLGGVQGLGSVTTLNLALGVSMGVVDNLEAGLLLLPIAMAPNFDFGDIELFTKYRFHADGNLEVGALATIRLPTDTWFAFAVGAPVVYMLGPYLRLEGGVELELVFDSTRLNLDVPVGVVYNLQPEIFLAAKTGFFLGDFESLAVPLGLTVGYTLVLPGVPMMDLIAALEWPGFLHSQQGLWLGLWRMTVGANVYFDISLP